MKLRGMQVMALTGGIASGKSTVCRFLREFIPSLEIFDCDAAVHRLLESDAEVSAIVAESFGEGALDKDGRVDRHFLRGRVFADDAARLRLEAILHPRVKEECLASIEAAAKRRAELFVELAKERGVEIKTLIGGAVEGTAGRLRKPACRLHLIGK